MTAERERLEYLRGCLRAECISLGELIELQNLVPFIDPSDVELLEAAGVPEFPDEGNEGTEMPPTHTPNGYDPRWVEAINGVLEDRGSPERIDDLDDRLWERFIGPLVDCIEDGYAVDEYDDEGDVIPAIYRPLTPPLNVCGIRHPEGYCHLPAGHEGLHSDGDEKWANAEGES